MVDKIYRCNICRTTNFAPEYDKIIGIKWAPNNEIEFLPPVNTETHICRKCLKEIIVCAKELK